MSSHHTTYALAIGLIALAFMPILLGMFRKNNDLFDLRYLFLVYVAIQLGVYPLYVEGLGVDYSYVSKDSFHARYYINLTLIYSCFGVSMYHLGYMVLRKGVIKQANVKWVGDAFRISLISIVLLIISVYSFYLSYLQNGFVSYIDNFNGLRYGFVDKNQMVSFMSTSLPCYVGVILYVWSNLTASKSRFHRVLICLFYIISLLASFLTGFRAVMAPLMLTMIASWHYNYRRFSTFAVVICLLMLFIFNSLYGSYRAAFESDRTFNVETDESAVRGLLLRSNALDVTAVVIDRIESGMVEYAGVFAGIYEASTMILPRKIWAAKPVPQGIIFSETVFNQPNGGISMSIIGYLYYQYGIIMIAVGMFLFGAASAVAQNAYRENQKSVVVKSLYIILVGLFPKFAEAPQETLNQVVLSLGTVGLIFLFSTKRRFTPV